MEHGSKKRAHRAGFVRLGLSLALLVGLLAGFAPRTASAATFNVNNNNDSGPGSLRAAILNANDNPGIDLISIDSGLSGLTIDLSTTLVLSDDVTIDGSLLNDPLTISGGDAVRVLQIGFDRSVTLINLKIARGNDATGAGIFNYGSLTLTDCILSGNAANSQGGGIYNFTGRSLIINNSSIIDNDTKGFGGGIYNDGSATITNSTISANSAASSGGGIYNNSGKELAITGSTITGNSAVTAGGILNAGTTTITVSTLAGNSAISEITGSGGGIVNNSTLSVTNSTFVSNTSNWGGAIANNSSLTVTNSTFSGNSAVPKDGFGDGGAIYHAVGDLSLSNTILANSASGVDCYANVLPDINSHNLVETSSGCGNPDSFITDDPNLGPLASYGGPTQTLALLPGSPALNAGGNEACPAADQRGILRPQGLACDIGAYEQELAAAVTNPASGITIHEAVLNGTINARGFASTVRFEYGLTTDYGTSVAAAPANVTGATSTAVSLALSGLQPATTYHFRVVATNSVGVSYGEDQIFTTLPVPWYNIYLPLVIQ